MAFELMDEPGSGFELMDEGQYNPTPQPEPQTAEDRAVQTPANPNYTEVELKPTPRAKAEKMLGDEGQMQQKAYEDYKDVLDLPASELRTFLDNASPENLREFQRATTVDRANFEEPGLEDNSLDFIGGTIGGAAGAAAGSRVAPKVIKALGRRGLTAPIKRALDRMKPDELNRLLKEMEMSKDMDLGDLILRADKDKYSEGIRPGDASSNKIEQKIFADETAAMGEKALPKAQELLQDENTLKATTNTAMDAIKAKDEQLAAPMRAAYDKAKTGASTERTMDTTVLNKNLRDYMVSQGATEAEAKAVMKILEPSGRVNTRAQKKAMNELEADRKTLEKGGLSAPRERALENRIRKNEKFVDEQDKYMSEEEMMNIIPNLESKLRSSGMSFTSTPNADRILRDVRNQYMDEADKLFKLKGSKRMDDLRAANTLAKKRYGYGDNSDYIRNVVNNNVQNPTQEMTNLFKTPEILNDIVEATGNSELGPTIANELVSQIGSAKTLKKAGAGDTLDFSATASQIEGLFSDTNKKNFLKKHLPEEKYNELIASRNVYGTLGPLMKELDEIPGMAERIMREPGLLGKAGEALKSMWDIGGYVKNRTLGKVPGFRWTDTAVNTSDKQIKRAEKVIRKNLDKIKRGEDISASDQKVLDGFVKYVGAIGGGAAGSAAGQAAQNYMTADLAPAKRKSYGAQAQLDSL